MSYFKNFGKTICSSRLSAPNNFVLTGHGRLATRLCTSDDPTLDHLNTLKALHMTIHKLSAHTNGNYGTLVASEIAFLNEAA